MKHRAILTDVEHTYNESGGYKMRKPFTEECEAVFEQAKKEAMDMGNEYVGSEHILLALVKEYSYLKEQLYLQVTYEQMKQDLFILFGSKQEAKKEQVLVTQIVEDLLMQASLHCEEKIAVKDLCCALLSMKNCVATEVLRRYHVDIERLYHGIYEDGIASLDQCENLKNMARGKENVHLVGREEEMELILSILERKEKANPLLIGEAGVGKSALVECLAHRLKQQQLYVYELDLNSLVAGTKYRGDFEEKIQTMLNLLKQHTNVILFVDEIHQMIGAGKSEGSIDVASVLKPYLARGHFRCIGATTKQEYEHYIAKDRALERRFQVVELKEPSEQQTLAMLKSKQEEYKRYHNVEFQESVLSKMVELCTLYLPNRHFPDKAIDVLDLACVKAKREGTKEVSLDHVQSVVEQISHIPNHNKQILQLKEELFQSIVGHKNTLTEIVLEMEQLHKKAGKHRPLGVWSFIGPYAVGKKTILNKLSQIYFQQEQPFFLNVEMMDHEWKELLFHVHSHPFGMIVIQNITSASKKIKQILQSVLKQGKVIKDGQVISFEHCLFVLLKEEEAFYKPFHFYEQKQETMEEWEAYVDVSFCFEPLTNVQQVEILCKQNDVLPLEAEAMLGVCKDRKTAGKQLKQKSKRKEEKSLFLV